MDFDVFCAATLGKQEGNQDCPIIVPCMNEIDLCQNVMDRA